MENTADPSQQKHNLTALFVRNGIVDVVVPQEMDPNPAASERLGTVLSNLSYYGHVPSRQVVERLLLLDEKALNDWWVSVQYAFSENYADDRNMSDVVVYKNFPAEVLNKSEAEYWVSQILMYWGFPAELFAETPEKREPLKLEANKVLHLASENAFENIYKNLVAAPYQWNNDQMQDATFLACDFLEVKSLDLSTFGHRGNGILLASHLLEDATSFKDGARFKGFTTTDVLRLAAQLSHLVTGCDVSLRKPPKFKRFTRGERRVLLGLLESCDDLAEGFSRNEEIWKRLLSYLHPGDFKQRTERVQRVYNEVYKGSLDKSSFFNSKVESLLGQEDPSVLKMLQERPGEFMRRLHHCYGCFGRSAFDAFAEVLPNLTTMQILKTKRYLETANDRTAFLAPPRGNWSRVQTIKNNKAQIDPRDISDLTSLMEDLISDRLRSFHPEGFSVDMDVAKVNIQSSDQELASYGRGTQFDIPKDVNFIRTASYWKFKKANYNAWFDNGVVFFDDNWNNKGVVTWNETSTFGGSVLFSGDPVISQNKSRSGCQLIDIDLDSMMKNHPKARYFVWTMICFSNQSFAKADDVVATLQWGEDPMQGNLYEPSRAQMVFPIKGDNLTRYVAYVDMHERKLVYVDLPLPSSLQSVANEKTIQNMEELMPHVVSYLEAQPTIYDLFSTCDKGSIPVRYSDKEAPIHGNGYVFQPENEESEISPLNLDKLLESKGGDTCPLPSTTLSLER